MDSMNKNPRCLGVNGATSKRPATRCLNHALDDHAFCKAHLHQATTLATHLNAERMPSEEQEVARFLEWAERVVHGAAKTNPTLMRTFVAFALDAFTDEDWASVERALDTMNNLRLEQAKKDGLVIDEQQEAR